MLIFILLKFWEDFDFLAQKVSYVTFNDHGKTHLFRMLVFIENLYQFVHQIM